MVALQTSTEAQRKLWAAAKVGDLDTVRSMITLKADPNARDATPFEVSGGRFTVKVRHEMRVIKMLCIHEV